MEYIRPPQDIPIHCPLCGRELNGSLRNLNGINGWQCECGEFIPENLVYNPFSRGRDRIEPHFERKSR